MKCSNCSNIITSYRDCIFCGSKCCCFVCLEQHYLSVHKNGNKTSKSKNQEEKQENKISPYLVSGIMNTRVKYNSKYSIENFIPVMEKGEIKTIGSGSFGQVYLALNTIDKKKYAIKYMDKSKLIKILHTLKGIYQEIDIQSRIDHPNIVKILYTDEDKDSFNLVMEYADNGSLFQYIRKNKGLNEYKTFQLFIQVVNAIYFLHENDLIHRDIKPENILLFSNNTKSNGNNSDYIVKLCDFGWCVKLDGQERDTFCGTTEYMSPELVNHKEYSKEIDVWSLGILLYEMIHGYSPFRPNKPKFKENDVIENIKKHNLKFSKKISEECKNLIYHLLAFNKNKRYKIGDIYNSEFVKFFESINYCIPKKFHFKQKIKIKKKEEKIEDDNINKINEIKTNNNNNFIFLEINENENINNNKKTPIFEIYNELKQLNKNNVEKVLTNYNTDNNIAKAFSQKKDNNENIYLGIRNKYNLSFINNKNCKTNYNICNNKINKKRFSYNSENNLSDKYIIKKNHSIQNDFRHNYKNPFLNDKSIRKNRTVSKKNGRTLNRDNKSLLNINIEKKQNDNSYFGNIKQKKNYIIKMNNKKNNITNLNSIINKEKTKNKVVYSNKKKNINKIIQYKNNIIKPLETNGRILLNTEQYNLQKKCDLQYLNHNLKDNLSYKNISQRVKTNINSTNNSKLKKEVINNTRKNKNLTKHNTIHKYTISERNKINKNEYSELKSFNQINSKMSLKKIKSISKISNIKKKYKDINSNFYENTNNEKLNHDTIKSELSPDCIFNQKNKKYLENFKIKSKTNFNNNQISPDFISFSKNCKLINSNSKLINKSPSYEGQLKENKKSIFVVNAPFKRQKIMHRKNMSISHNKINNINIYKNILKHNSKSQSFKLDKYKNEKRKINSAKNKSNKIKRNPFDFNCNMLSNGKLNNKNNIRIIGINKNLFHEKDIELSQSDKEINNSIQKNNLSPSYNNFVSVKTQKIENNNIINNEKLIKQIKNISPEKYINLMRNNTAKNLKRLSPSYQFNTKNYTQMQNIKNIKLKNKKSFCFISRNKNSSKMSKNKYENIFCGPINNINYQNNNINNFYIINSSNISNEGTHLNQKNFKKQFTEHQREVKNIDYSKLMPISLIEGGYVNHTFNKSKNINIMKDSNKIESLNKKRHKLNLKYYLMKSKNKRIHSYNSKKDHFNYEKSNSKDSNSGIIYIDSGFSDNTEKNDTPKKNKDNMKINPIKLLGDFQKEYTIFHKHNKISTEYSGIKA